MNMTSQTTFLGTPEDLKVALNEVIAPLVERIHEMEKQIGIRLEPKKQIFTVNELAKYVRYSPQMVRRFITDGKLSRKGKTIYLKAKEITKGDYRITYEALEEFLSHF